MHARGLSAYQSILNAVCFLQTVSQSALTFPVFMPGNRQAC